MGRSFCFNGQRNKKLIRSPHFLSSFHVATSYGHRVFKTECIDDLTIEQVRVLAALLDKENKEAIQASERQISEIPSNSQKGKTTYRISNG